MKNAANNAGCVRLGGSFGDTDVHTNLRQEIRVE
jgi:hypothetical protein